MSGNRLLDALAAVRGGDGLLRRAQRVRFAPRDALLTPGDPLDLVLFPTSGLISVVVSTECGATVEASSAGREGMVGGLAVLGGGVCHASAIAQIEGEAFRLPAADFRTFVFQSSEAGALVFRHAYLSVAEARQEVACQALHDAHSRLARWLVDCAEKVDSSTLCLN